MEHSGTEPADDTAPAEVDGPVKFVTSSDGMIELIDATDPQVGLFYTRDEIAAFIHGAKHGEFDHLLPSPS